MFSIVSIASAQTPGLAEAQSFVARVNEVILYPLIALLFALAFFLFIFGCYQYLTHADESQARETGKMHILWGILGMFIMLVAYGILGIAASTFGLNQELDCYNDPTQGGCDAIFNPYQGFGTGNTGGSATGNTGGSGSGNTGGAGTGNR